MRVFISWSGEQSRQVAEALRDWLPRVLQAIQPWVSATDIEKGASWRSGLLSELEHARVGIICLTPENLDSPWIHFEVGALSKQQQNTYVCTFLLGLEPIDVREPLSQFQATKAEKEDIGKLLHTMNRLLAAPLTEGNLDEAFNLWWPMLEPRLAAIPQTEWATKPPRDARGILEEVLQLVREIAAKTLNPTSYQQNSPEAKPKIVLSYEPASEQLFKLINEEQEDAVRKLRSLLSSRALLEKDKEESDENVDS